nr:LacI family DNA-binding transcriptional regulator [uncultured Sphaerochaeta sp.]
MANLKEIAAKAGVSMITVSRVINTPEKVAPKTRNKILSIMSEVEYVPNTAAKNLVSKRSGIIFVYVSHEMSLLDPFMGPFLVGVSAGLTPRNYSLSLINDVDLNRFCDGYIFSGHNYSDHALEICKKSGKPIALFGHIDDPCIDCIDTDNVKSAKIVVRHLVSHGHTRIAIILNTVNGDYVKDRFEGYKQALEEAGIKVEESLVHTVNNSIEGGREAAQWYSKYAEGATAVFCITDIIAVGFIFEAQAMGLCVPDDVSVAGFDGLGHHLLSNPKLTTVVQPVFEISKRLAQSLLEKIFDQREKRICKVMDGELLEEDSVTKL